jgi:hypothetical protein
MLAIPHDSLIWRLTGRNTTFTLDVVKVWLHALFAVGLVFVLANPVCACLGEQSLTPEPVHDCCSQPADDDSGKPISPCCCDTSVREGLPQINDSLAKPMVAFCAKPKSVTQWVEAIQFFPLPIQSVKFRGPPLRHLYSVYRF